jgi:hypothetical protein
MSVASILQQMAETSGRSKLARGQLIGQTVAGLSQVPGQMLADKEQQRAFADQRARQQRQDARQDRGDMREDAAGQRAAQRDEALKRALAAGFSDSPDPAQFNMSRAAQSALDDGFPEVVTTVSEIHKKLLPQFTSGAPGSVMRDDAGQVVPGSEIPATRPDYTIDNQRFSPDGTPIGAPVPVAAKKYPVTVPGPNGGPITKLVSEEEMRAGVPAYRDPKTPAEPQRFWVFRDGKPVRVTEQEYRPGDLPGNTREQGRPVTSGDAGRLAELTSSLDDVSRLKLALGEAKATGVAAKAGAMLPNAVTEFTGWGADAKKKQALIDRVKQVIGKALEGGVLRKEDELKYEKILPTIGDPPEIVTAKIAGLDAAIAQKHERQLESLSDAGYDVAKFQARTTPPPAPPAAPQSTVAPKVTLGQVLTVKGQKVRVTKIGKDGQYEGVPVK